MGFTFIYSDSPANTNLINVAYTESGSTIAVLENTVSTIESYAFQNCIILDTFLFSRSNQY